ncbi:hypothetical protein ACFV0C_12415 [Streptomyces sp. NPDC059568]|uniref:hypothetical protein n=1 Tax=Streptomyces sp. NPDC059568 TaxID=3346868 RepID=UPI003698FA00
MRERTCPEQAPRHTAYPTQKIKTWCGMATRYDKSQKSFEAGLRLRGSTMWLKHLTSTT